MRERLHLLEVEHHDLDDVIVRLAADPTQDQLQLAAAPPEEAQAVPQGPDFQAAHAPDSRHHCL